MAARISQFQATLEDLGLQEYHNNLVENGFDTWDSLADITEVDMATLGLKLGHRRKLQRELAGRAGHPAVEPLFGLSAFTPQSSTKAQHSEELIKNKSIHARRRYRKRPLRDLRAPTRPDTGYVAYSRFLRQNPEISNHSFVETARFVGAQWSCLSLEEKDVWNSGAAAQKQLYDTKLAEYRNEEYQVDKRQTGGKKLLQSPLKSQIYRTKVSGVPDDYSSRPSSNNSSLFPETCYTQTDQYPTSQASIPEFWTVPASHSAASTNSTTCADEANFSLTCNINTLDRFATDSSEVGRDVPLLDSIWTIISRERGSDLAAQSLWFDQEDLSPYALRHLALSKSFHVQVINPFEFQTRATVWPMIESFLQNVNSIYYLVNPNLLVQHLNSAFLADQRISNCTMSMLCICIGIGCQSSNTGTDDLALMWYENGRRYLDDHDWCINLAVMQALALIGMFHIGQRPSTSTHYLDAATRIGESNDLHKITPHSSQPGDHSEWLHIWETIQTMRRILVLGYDRSSAIMHNRSTLYATCIAQYDISENHSPRPFYAFDELSKIWSHILQESNNREVLPPWKGIVIRQRLKMWLSCLPDWLSLATDPNTQLLDMSKLQDSLSGASVTHKAKLLQLHSLYLGIMVLITKPSLQRTVATYPDQPLPKETKTEDDAYECLDCAFRLIGLCKVLYKDASFPVHGWLPLCVLFTSSLACTIGIVWQQEAHANDIRASPKWIQQSALGIQDALRIFRHCGTRNEQARRQYIALQLVSTWLQRAAHIVNIDDIPLVDNF